MRNNSAYREKWLSVLAFVLASACLSFAFAFSIAEKVSSEWQYLAPTQNTVQIDFLNPVTPTDIKTIRETENVLYMLPYSTPIAYTLTDATVMQTQSNSWSLRDRAFFIPDSNANSLILGKIPTSSLEILLDEKLAEEMLADCNPEYPTSVLGYTGLQNFLGAKITFDTLTSEYTVVGITKSRFPVYYVSEDTLQTIAIGVSLQSPFDVVSQANYISSSGEKIPLKDNEIVISQDLARDLSVNISDTMTFLETPYAVRSIRSDAQNSVFLNEINMESISEKLCFSEIQELLVLTDDGQNTAASLSDKGYNAIAWADITEADAQNNFRQRVLVSRIVFGLILFCAGIALFLSEKGRMLVQKKSYTVRRTLGLSGNRILFTDMLCSLKKACFIAIPLFSLLVLLMNKIAIALQNVLPFVQISFPKYLLGVGILFLLSVLSTALAEWKYYRMTPAALLKG